MGVELAAWRGGANVVTTADGVPRLWLTSDGDLCDRLGAQVTAERDHVHDVGDLMLFVAEWLFCVAQSHGPVAYRDIHPDIFVRIHSISHCAIRGR
jgi:hypothetical protein